MDNQYKEDKDKDINEDVGCNKDYNKSPNITGGLTHITCIHNITKGFTALHRGDSPLIILSPSLRRLPVRVQGLHCKLPNEFLYMIMHAKHIKVH